MATPTGKSFTDSAVTAELANLEGAIADANTAAGRANDAADRIEGESGIEAGLIEAAEIRDDVQTIAIGPAGTLSDGVTIIEKPVTELHEEAETFAADALAVKEGGTHSTLGTIDAADSVEGIRDDMAATLAEYAPPDPFDAAAEGSGGSQGIKDAAEASGRALVQYAQITNADPGAEYALTLWRKKWSSGGTVNRYQLDVEKNGTLIARFLSDGYTPPDGTDDVVLTPQGSVDERVTLGVRWGNVADGTVYTAQVDMVLEPVASTRDLGLVQRVTAAEADSDSLRAGVTAAATALASADVAARALAPRIDAATADRQRHLGTGAAAFFRANGSDAAAGTRRAPKLTPTAGTDTTRALARGSRYGGGLSGAAVIGSIGTGEAGLHVTDYLPPGVPPGAPLPIFDQYRQVTTWADLGETFEATWAHLVGRDKADILLWVVDADGIPLGGAIGTSAGQLVRLDTAAAVSSTPGSYHVDYSPGVAGNGTGPAASPVTITLHVADGGLIPSSGRYWATYHPAPVRAGEAGIIEGVHARFVADENGLWAGDGGRVARSVAAYFGIHAATVLGTYGTIEDVVGWMPAPILTGSTRKNIVFVVALPTATGGEAHFVRCLAIGGGGDGTQLANTDSFTTHSDSATPTLVHALARIVDCVAADVSGGVPCAAGRVEIDGFYARGTTVAVNPTTAALDIRRLLANRPGSTAIKLLLPSGITSGTMTLRECLIYSVTATAGSVVAPPSGVPLTIEDSVLVSAATRALAVQGNSLTVNRCVLMTDGNAVDAGGGSGGVGTYTGNHNLFLFPAGTFKARYRGTVYTSLSAWQTATGQDADSVALLGTAATEALASIASGDARLPAGLLDGTALEGLSVGLPSPPSAWPVVPESEAEAAAYVASL